MKTLILIISLTITIISAAPTHAIAQTPPTYCGLEAPYIIAQTSDNQTVNEFDTVEFIVIYTDVIGTPPNFCSLSFMPDSTFGDCETGQVDSNVSLIPLGLAGLDLPPQKSIAVSIGHPPRNYADTCTFTFDLVQTTSSLNGPTVTRTIEDAKVIIQFQ